MCVYIYTLVTVRAPEIFLGIMQIGIIQKICKFVGIYFVSFAKRLAENQEKPFCFLPYTIKKRFRSVTTKYVFVLTMNVHQDSTIFLSSKNSLVLHMMPASHVQLFFYEILSIDN